MGSCSPLPPRNVSAWSSFYPLEVDRGPGSEESASSAVGAARGK